RTAVQRAPEVIEAIAEPGPFGLSHADFVRARIELLRLLGDESVGKLIAQLLAGKQALPSVVIESRIEQDADIDFERLHVDRQRAIAYILATLVGNRAGLAEMVDGLAAGKDLESTVMERILE